MEREITKFEEQCLKNEWIDGYADEYSLEENEAKFKEWKNSLSWIEVDEIVSHYTNEE